MMMCDSEIATAAPNLAFGLLSGAVSWAGLVPDTTVMMEVSGPMPRSMTQNYNRLKQISFFVLMDNHPLAAKRSF